MAGRRFPVEEVIAGKKEDLTRRSHLSAWKKKKRRKLERERGIRGAAGLLLRAGPSG
jgi:hypothetical protein